MCVRTKRPDEELSTLTEPFPLQDEIERNLRNLQEFHQKILNLKSVNTSNIQKSKNKEEILYLFYVRDLFNDFLNDLEDGILSANMLLEFFQLNHLINSYKNKMNHERETLLSSLSKSGNIFISLHQKFKNMNILHEIKDVELNHLGYSLYLLDEFHFNKEKIENSIWNMALESNSNDKQRNLPHELFLVKWFCNQDNDDVECVEELSQEYISLHKCNKILITNLCYVAKSFFDCSNFKCSKYIIKQALEVMKNNNLDNQMKFFFIKLCGGLLEGKLINYEKGYKTLIDCVNFLRSKEGNTLEGDIVIGCQIMNVGCVLVNWGVSDVGIELLCFSIMLFEENLPHSYSNWEEAIILCTRFCNDINEFKNALKIAAPLFDYFHILHFGSIKDNNKPIYELALEVSLGTRIHTVTKNFKYPLFLPKNVSVILTEMIISFSGLGDRSSALVIENWIDRCKMFSSSFKYLVIENFDYSWFPNIEKVIYKMRQNSTYHDKLFTHGKIEKR